MSKSNHNPQRSTTRAKYLALQKRYEYLYDVKRIRHDDVIKQLMKEFYISQDSTIYRILSTQVLQEDERLQKIPGLE